MVKIVEKNGGFEVTDVTTPGTIAMPVEETLGVLGLPGKTVMAETLVKVLTMSTFRDLPESLSVEKVAEALESLVYIRICQLHGRRIKHDGLDYARMNYPGFMFPLLRAIGNVEDHEDAVYLTVVAEGNMLRFEEKGYDWDSIVETLQDIRNYGMKNGLEFAGAMPREKDGVLTIITFLVDDAGNMSSHTSNKDGAHALLRSAYEFRFSNYVWGAPRWEYNNISYYRNIIGGMVADSVRAYA